MSAHIPSGFEDAVNKLLQLEGQKQYDPQIIIELIQEWEHLLGQISSTRYSSFYGYCHFMLGINYYELPAGDRVSNLKHAITCYEEALRFWMPKNKSEEYASIQFRMGMAYRNLPTADKASNLKRAITCYQETLRVWTPKNNPQAYASVQNNLGNAYNELLTGNRTDNLKRAISCYQETLHHRKPKTPSLEYASTLFNLGGAYNELLTGNRTANLKYAIARYEEALLSRTPETAPLDYAVTISNLGNAHAQLPTGDQTTNLEYAIACYEKALHFQTPETAPLDYAATKHNLGAAYSNLRTGDRIANMMYAITCYEEALRFWTPETTPLGYAVTQHNLGNVCSKLPVGDRTAHQEYAVTCYKEALRFRTPETTPLDYAMTMSSLGDVYSTLPTGDRTANLKSAIVCYEKALLFQTPETAPLDYAATQGSLGNAYRILPEGDRSTQLRRAIACYQEALRFMSPKTAPLEYALTQRCLGNAYRDLPMGNRNSNLKQAIAYYQEALRFQTPEISPEACRVTSRNLASIFFEQGEWKSARETYRTAIEAGEILYRSDFFKISKAEEIAENATLYHQAAFASVRCKEMREALLILEKGKTRLLTEVLRLQTYRPIDIPDNVWSIFEQAKTDVHNQQIGEMRTFNENHIPAQQMQKMIQVAHDANNKLNIAIESIRAYAPHFLEEMDFSILQAQIPDIHSALITFCITELGSMGFIITQQQSDVQIVEVPLFTQKDLYQLLIGVKVADHFEGGWLRAYDTKQAQQETIEKTLVELGNRLLTPILSTLPYDITHLIIVPSLQLVLFPLHAVPISIDSSVLVCDRYRVSYTPSIEVLSKVRAKVPHEIIPRLYAVINPASDPNFIFTPVEGNTIAQFFVQSTIDHGPDDVCTKKHVSENVKGHTYVHFSCHGNYNQGDPAASGLDLADGRLSLAELQQGLLGLSLVRLVTLSACETGISDSSPSNTEEYIGISAGFLVAGVPCVVSSLWDVDELATFLLMKKFYQNHLREGKDIVSALNEAQCWLRKLPAGDVVTYIKQCYKQSGETSEDMFEAMLDYCQGRCTNEPVLNWPPW